MEPLMNVWKDLNGSQDWVVQVFVVVLLTLLANFIAKKFYDRLEVQFSKTKNLWDDALAASMTESEKLLYRSNLLGSDKRVTNYGGGNTSAKVMEMDPLTGEMAEVLWVKGSGGDIGSMKMDSVATAGPWREKDAAQTHASITQP